MVTGILAKTGLSPSGISTSPSSSEASMMSILSVVMVLLELLLLLFSLLILTLLLLLFVLSIGSIAFTPSLSSPASVPMDTRMVSMDRLIVACFLVFSVCLHLVKSLVMVVTLPCFLL